MRSITFYLLILFIPLITYSCNHPCSDTECYTGNQYGNFRVVSRNDGTDLLFGDNKVYDKNAIRVYAISGADTVFFKTDCKDFFGSDYDSVIEVHFTPLADTAYIQLSPADIDTIKVVYKTYTTECCGTIKDITGFTGNNLSDSAGVQNIRK